MFIANVSTQRLKLRRSDMSPYGAKNERGYKHSVPNGTFENLQSSYCFLLLTTYRLLAHRGLYSPWCFNKALVPQFKHKQGPEKFPMIGHAALVFIL